MLTADRVRAGMIQGLVFVSVSLALALLAILALFRVGTMRLESPLGRLRDGFPNGTMAPRWVLPDLMKVIHHVPSGSRWQLLVFVDHSLVEFPGLAKGLSTLSEDVDLEIVVLTKGKAESTQASLGIEGLQLPVVQVDNDFYLRHNVRVMPHLFVLTPEGLISTSGIVSHEDTVVRMWRSARVLPPRSSDYANVKPAPAR